MKVRAGRRKKTPDKVHNVTLQNSEVDVIAATWKALN